MNPKENTDNLELSPGLEEKDPSFFEKSKKAIGDSVKIALFSLLTNFSSQALADEVKSENNLAENYVPGEVLLGNSYEIHRYLSENLGIEIKQSDILSILKADKPLIGVVPKGKELYEVDIKSLSLPSKITRESLKDFFLSKLLPREQYPEQQERYESELTNILTNNPDIVDNLLSSINMYLSIISKEEKINPYLIERALKSMLTIQTKISVDPDLEKTTDLAFASDIYYLFVALGLDISNAQKLVLKGGEQYTILPIDKRMALDLEEKTGISLPLKSIERYGEIYTDYVYALNNREARNPKQAERNKAYAEEYIEKFSNLSLPGQIQALSLYEAGKSEEMGRGMNYAMLAMQATLLQSGIEKLVGYLNGEEDLKFDLDVDIVGNGNMLKRRAPGTSSMITEEYMANLSEIYDYVSLKSRREVEEGRRRLAELDQEIEEGRREVEEGRRRLAELDKLLEKAKILAGV